MAKKNKKSEQKKPKTPLERLAGELQRQIVALLKSNNKENEIHTAVTCTLDDTIQIKLEPRCFEDLPSDLGVWFFDYLTGCFMDTLEVLMQRVQVGWHNVRIRFTANTKDECVAEIVPAY